MLTITIFVLKIMAMNERNYLKEGHIDDDFR
jgi:hypothetical protein